jgi:hypothetical protein
VASKLVAVSDLSFGLFQAAADNLHQAATALLDMRGDLSDPQAKAKHLADLKHEGDPTRQICRWPPRRSSCRAGQLS